jgi:hypothetical protein
VAQPFNTDRFLLFVGGFAGKGPFFGWLIVWIELTAIALWSRDFPGGPDASLLQMGASLIFFLIFSLLVAYLFSGVPAAVTGLLCYPLSRIPMPVWAWVVSCAIVGAAVCTGVAGLLTHSISLDETMLVAAVLPGAAAGAVCGWFARGRRLSL